MKARAVVDITDNGIDVVLWDWEGVPNSVIERIQYAIIKKSHEHRAQELGKIHAAKMAAESATAAEKSVVPNDGLFIKELENALS